MAEVVSEFATKYRMSLTPSERYYDEDTIESCYAAGTSAKETAEIVSSKGGYD